MTGFARRVTALTAVATVVKLVYLVGWKWSDDLRLNDSLYYSIQAGRNSEGDWFRETLSDLPGAEHGPITSLYLTPWSLGSGDALPWQRLGMVVAGIAVIPLVALIGRRLGGERVGLVAAWLAALYPNLWMNDFVVMSETLAIALVAATVLVALRLDERPRPVGHVALGVLIGLAALTRSELALLAPLLAAVAFARGGRAWRGPVLVLVASALTVAPWTIYNLARFERPVLLSTNDGTTLLGANCDATYDVDIGGWNVECLGPIPGDEDASVRSARFRGLAVDYVTDHVGRVPVVVAARVGRILDVYAVRRQVGMDVAEEKLRWAAWLGVGMWWVLAVAAVAGWRRLATAGRGERWWLLPLPVTVLVTTVLFWGAHRIRAPAEPVVVVLAALAMVAWWDRLRDSRP